MLASILGVVSTVIYSRLLDKYPEEPLGDRGEIPDLGIRMQPVEVGRLVGEEVVDVRVVARIVRVRWRNETNGQL